MQAGAFTDFGKKELLKKVMRYLYMFITHTHTSQKIL